jgi:hypothetical protein
MADDPRARGGEQDEGVAVGEFLALARPRIVERPEKTAMPGVAMALQDRLHAMIDEIAGARPAHEMADREAMNHARRRVQRARGIVRQCPAGVIERMEAAGGIERFGLEDFRARAALLQVIRSSAVHPPVENCLLRPLQPDYRAGRDRANPFGRI